MTGFETALHLWGTFGIILISVILYATERLPMELVSVGTIASLLVLFTLIESPVNLTARDILAGFADPALVTVLALMVMGQGLVQTGALEAPISKLSRFLQKSPLDPAPLLLVLVMIASAFVSNTPVVVIAIPILTALARHRSTNPARMLMPLSFAAIMGGMTTLIGTSPNLLISSTLETAGYPALGFFDFTAMGLILVSVGWLYVSYLAPSLATPKNQAAPIAANARGKQFIAQLEVHAGSSLAGEQSKAGLFPGLTDLSMRTIQRGATTLLPPFDEVTLQPGDILTVAATRKQLTQAIAKRPDLLSGATGRKFASDAKGASESDLALAEVAVPPTARLVGRTLDQNGFLIRTNCAVLAIERRSRMIRSASLTNTVIEPGDVLLIVGRNQDIAHLGKDHEVMMLAASLKQLQTTSKAKQAILIFCATILAAATGVLPIVVSALVGATAMVTFGCLTPSRALRSMDVRILLLIAAAIAMGSAMFESGGAQLIADTLIIFLMDMPAVVSLSTLFLIVAVMTNLLSNAAAAVLFTPIAVSMSENLGLPATPFIHAVIFAVSCSFATPMGYQTNLLVMGPGHYRFIDFVKTGTPLIILLWLTFTLVAPWFYGLS